MSQIVVKQRQRHKLPQWRPAPRVPAIVAVVVVIVIVTVLESLVLLPQPVNCQQQQQLASQYNQHRQLPAASLSNLVNSGHHQLNLAPQSLPLQRQQGQDLDNVIVESTTPFLQQNVAASSAAASAKLEAPEMMTSTISGGCQLPPTWAGRWYQSNKEPIRITNTEISDKGVCRDQKGDKYLFEYSGGSRHQQQAASSSQSAMSSSSSQTPSASNEAPCLVCLRFIDRHLNALQYKESSCQPIPANYYNRSTQNLIVDDHSLLDSICDDINGDNPLESLFRLDTPSIECPISGQYMFSYDSCRGEPQSTLDSCIDKKQLNFKFSACPDVVGSESKSK